MPNYVTERQISTIEDIATAVAEKKGLKILKRYDKQYFKPTHLLGGSSGVTYLVKASKRSTYPTLKAMRLKNRRYMFGQEGTKSMLSMAELEGAKKALMLVLFSDGNIYSLNLAEALVDAETGVGGRVDRGDAKDIEPQYYFNTEHFKFICTLE